MLCSVLPEQAGRGEHRPARHVLLRRVAQLVRRAQQDALQVVQIGRLPYDLRTASAQPDRELAITGSTVPSASADETCARCVYGSRGRKCLHLTYSVRLLPLVLPCAEQALKQDSYQCGVNTREPPPASGLGSGKGLQLGAAER